MFYHDSTNIRYGIDIKQCKNGKYILHGTQISYEIIFQMNILWDWETKIKLQAWGDCIIFCNVQILKKKYSYMSLWFVRVTKCYPYMYHLPVYNTKTLLVC